MTYVVSGVTGNTGSIVADVLLSRGERVRVIVRDAARGEPWKAKGAEVAIASLEDSGAVAKALEGARGAYFLVPPNVAAEDVLADRAKVTDAIVDAVRASGIAHVVFLSSIGAHRESGTGPIRIVHDAEKKLRAVAKNVTFVRAPYFLENFAPMIPVAKQSGALPVFWEPSAKIPMASVGDIGRVAAEALLEGPNGVKVIELSGPEDVSPEDVARAIGVGTTRVPVEAIVPTFTSFGFSNSIAELYREMLENVTTIAFEGGEAVPVRGNISVQEGVARLA